VSNLLLVAMVVVLFVNYALVRITGGARRGVAYWFVQAINVAAVAYFVVVGLPDLPRIADFFLAVLYVNHGIQNELRARGADARDEMNRP
jgi:hypothetical protein